MTFLPISSALTCLLVPSAKLRILPRGLLKHSSDFSKVVPASTAVRRFTVLSSMAPFFKPEEARFPPAIPLPSPPISKFKIALCQLSVTEDKARNIAHTRKAIEEAASKGAQLVLLPEIWNSPYSNDSFPLYAEDIEAGDSSAPSYSMLSEASRNLKITIIGGSIPERSGDKLYNTCCIFGTDGSLKGKHRKLHLFDIDIPGKITFKESQTLTAGQHPTIVDTDVGRIGIGICYDVRFQELAMLYAARGAHLICYPGAFNMTTGPLHWELLQRARAADNQQHALLLEMQTRDTLLGVILPLSDLLEKSLQPQNMMKPSLWKR